MLQRLKDFFAVFRATKGKEYKTGVRQYWEMTRLFLLYRLSPIEYSLYEMGRRDFPAQALREYIITRWAVKVMRPRFTSSLWGQVLRNKVLFRQHLTAHNLPGAEFYGFFHPRFGRTAAGAPLRAPGELEALLATLPGRELIVKPVGGFKGSGVFKVRTGAQGEVVQGGEALAKACGWSDGFLLEECLVNHPEIRAYNPSSLNTCRVVTLVTAAGECKFLFATARFGRKGSVADNWGAGGVAVGVDLPTGVMGRGRILPQYGGGWVDCHPDSGKPFVGQVLPHWQELLDLVKRAALTLPCATVGWDVAITPSGPVLVEGNSAWDPTLGQAFVGGLLTPELRQDLAELGLKRIRPR
ncbi:MAG TPA: sugar-transfer associated ATP-grasp domain-containing protein [Bacillota bacterium]|nr:sugar-transfer associated ATP-grasp domain-containing protein [Bacillota bacterium]